MDLQQFFFSKYVFWLQLNSPGIYISILMVGRCHNRKKLHFLGYFDPYPINTLNLFEKILFVKNVLEYTAGFFGIF